MFGSEEVKLLQKSDVAYSIPGHDCNSIYIGETSMNLSGRIISHKRDCTLQHTLETGHYNILIQILFYFINREEQNNTFISVKCLTLKNSLNRTSQIKHLTQIYNYILTFDNFSNFKLSLTYLYL